MPSAMVPVKTTPPGTMVGASKPSSMSSSMRILSVPRTAVARNLMRFNSGVRLLMVGPTNGLRRVAQIFARKALCGEVRIAECRAAGLVGAATH